MKPMNMTGFEPRAALAAAQLLPPYGAVHATQPFAPFDIRAVGPIADRPLAQRTYGQNHTGPTTMQPRLRHP